MADPNSVVSSIRSAIKATRIFDSSVKLGDEMVTGKPVIGYPSDILGIDSEVNRAVKFSAYQYQMNTTVGNGKDIQNKSKNTHQWSCYLPFLKLNEKDTQEYNNYESWGMGEVKLEDLNAMVENAKAGEIVKTFESAGSVVSPLASKAAYGALRDFVGKDWNVARRNFANGMEINPLTSIIFSGSKLRTFSFSFPMIARSAKESEDIRTIIRKFKYHSRPSAGKQHVANVATFNISAEVFLHPSIWEIEFIGSSTGNSGTTIQDFLPKIKTCCLKEVEVNYKGGGEGENTVFCRDTGAPVVCELTLTFQEMYINTSQDAEEGY